MSSLAPFRFMAALFCAALLSSACAEPPNREMDQAQGAIDAARAARADRYATAEYEAAVKALKGAQDAVAQRDYRLALNFALDSRERAQNAAKEAADQQVTLRSGAERRLGELTAMLNQAKQRLNQAETARGARRSLAPAHAAVSSAEASLQEASTEIQEGDYQAGETLLAETGARLREAIAESEAAIAGRELKGGR